MANFSVTESLFIAGGGELLQDLVRIAFSLAAYVILRRIWRFLTQPVPASATLVAGNDSVKSASSTLTCYEWLVLIQQDPDRARQISVSLQERVKREGVMAEVSLAMSLANYEETVQFLDEAATDPKQAQRMASYAKIGQVLLRSYPRYDDWLSIIDKDPVFAQQLCVALQIKQVVIGPHSPHDLVASIAMYHLITSSSAPR